MEEGSTMTSFEMAMRLNGNQYLSEMTREDERIAKENGLVVVFGYSDDNVEFRGAIKDEIGCFDGGDVWIDKTGIVREEDRPNHPEAKLIRAVWCGLSGASWEYETEIWHDTFNIYEDGELYCVGIVFALEDV